MQNDAGPNFVAMATKFGLGAEIYTPTGLLLLLLSVLTLTCTVPATMPSTVDSANGSNCRSFRRMKSGLRMYPQRPLYSNVPRFSCIARSGQHNHSHALHLSNLVPLPSHRFTFLEIPVNLLPCRLFSGFTGIRLRHRPKSGCFL